MEDNKKPNQVADEAVSKSTGDKKKKEKTDLTFSETLEWLEEESRKGHKRWKKEREKMWKGNFLADKKKPDILTVTIHGEELKGVLNIGRLNVKDFDEDEISRTFEIQCDPTVDDVSVFRDKHVGEIGISIEVEKEDGSYAGWHIENATIDGRIVEIEEGTNNTVETTLIEYRNITFSRENMRKVAEETIEKDNNSKHLTCTDCFTEYQTDRGVNGRCNGCHELFELKKKIASEKDGRKIFNPYKAKNSKVQSPVDNQ